MELQAPSGATGGEIVKGRAVHLDVRQMVAAASQYVKLATFHAATSQSSMARAITRHTFRDAVFCASVALLCSNILTEKVQEYTIAYENHSLQVAGRIFSITRHLHLVSACLNLDGLL